MGRLLIGILALGLLACEVGDAPPVPEGWLRIPMRQDSAVSAYPGERQANLGWSPRLKTKGVLEMTLFDIDPAQLRGRVIEEAVLHVRMRGDEPQRRVTVGTVATPWVEGTSHRYDAQPGSVCFESPALGERHWTVEGSDLTDAILSIWAMADATPPDEDGRQSIPVDPRVVAARAAGLSHGFVVIDDTGHEYERNGESFKQTIFPNRFFYSREAGPARAPFLAVRLGPEDREPPERIHLGVRVDGEFLRWETPPDRGPAGTLGFLVRAAPGNEFDWESATPVARHLIPMAGGTVEMRLPIAEGTVGVRPVDAAGNVGPVSRVTFKAPVHNATTFELPEFEAQPGTNPTVAGIEVAVLDATDKGPPWPDGYLTSNHLWTSADRIVRLHAARNEFVAFLVMLEGEATGVRASIDFPGGKLMRCLTVPTAKGPLPDPLLDLDGPIDVAGRATLLAEIYVPHDGRSRKGRLVIEAGGEHLEIAIDFTVWNFTLPDHLSFLPEMNCYGLPIAQEHAYHRLAHRHRVCLNRLGYNWRGIVADGYAPTIRKDGTWDWTGFDRRFGPLFDGSAFKDLPRGPVPVEVFYLPLNENWPVPFERWFRGGYWADEALPAEYFAAFTHGCSKVAQHLHEKGWRDTLFEFYLNGKVQHKRGGWSRSSAVWTYDEPVNTQDFWALRQFGLAFHEGVAPYRSEVRAAFRIDNSRPQWMRDLLDGLVDVHIVGGAFRQYSDRVVERKRRFGEIAITYGTSNKVEASNLFPIAWCLESWSLGADGVLPWQTVGNPGSWDKDDELSLFYRGERVGKDQPLPSLRLKAYRRGQQDVEYLTLAGADREWARTALGLDGEWRQSHSDDAGSVRYADLDPIRFWRMRQALGRHLDKLAPPPRNRLVEFKLPPRDPRSIRGRIYRVR